MKHDIIEVHDSSVTCACGRTITGTSLEDARRKHDAYFYLADLRAVLEEARQA